MRTMRGHPTLAGLSLLLVLLAACLEVPAPPGSTWDGTLDMMDGELATDGAVDAPEDPGHAESMDVAPEIDTGDMTDAEAEPPVEVLDGEDDGEGLAEVEVEVEGEGEVVGDTSDTESCDGLSDACLPDEHPDLVPGPCERLTWSDAVCACVRVNRPVMAPCDDGLNCTLGDYCLQNGTCIGTPADERCDDDDPCTEDTCALLDGCAHGPAPGDGACEADQTCQDGYVCVNEICARACDDGQACTQGDACQQGACVPGPEVSACKDCEPSEGLCDVLFGDQDICTGVLDCVQVEEGHECVFQPGSVITCPTGNDTDCLRNTCDPTSGVCSMTPPPDDTICSDGNPCTHDDRCAGGACVGTPEEGGEVCGCVTDEDCLPYDDADACNGILHCMEAHCLVDPGTIVICDTTGDSACMQTVCQPETGACEAEPLAPEACDPGLFPDLEIGPCEALVFSFETCACEVSLKPLLAACDDQDACTQEDACDVQGLCQGASLDVALACDDQNPCTDDTCAPALGCVNELNDAPCDDGNLCTDGDTCVEGSCLAGAYDLSSCSGCDEADDTCESLYGDTNACNGTLHCVNGQCALASETIVHCEEPADDCLRPTCEAQTGSCGTEPVTDGAACSDGNTCTTGDQCQLGACVGSFDTSASGCACLEDADCAAFDDGDLCTGVLHCVEAQCVVDVDSVPAPCDTSGDAPCTRSACAPQTGQCVPTFLPLDPSCDDGDPCTTDTCDELSQGCVSALTEKAGVPELCNDLDDDCDGLTDAEDAADLLADDPRICDGALGVCAGASRPPGYCQGGTWLPCDDTIYAQLPAYDAGPDASCDALDNDCDGQTDEDYAAIASSCGQGACASIGTLTCVDGAVTDTCVISEAQTETDDACDGVDEDCDGQTDEDFVAFASSCGEGACAASGEITCAQGAEVDTCAPGTADDEICDGLDNDCDGQTDAADSDLTLPPGEGGQTGGGGEIPCSLTLGVCAGATRPVDLCSGGGWQTCDVLVYEDHAPTYEGEPEESFDGLDNDCDGDTDEGLTDPDPDGDGVPSDGDASGTIGDAPCASGVTVGCDDSCPEQANADQLDSDGDGLGNACDPSPAGLSEGFVFIPRGSFWMGSPEEGADCPDGYTGGGCAGDGSGTMLGEPEREDREGLHHVTLTRDFELMATEVTRAGWRAVAQAQGWGEEPSWFTDCEGGDACPVERINWFEALAFANARSEAAGLEACYVLSGCTGALGGGCGEAESGCTQGTYGCTDVALKSPYTRPQECLGYRLPTDSEWEYAYRAGSVTTFHPSVGNDGRMLQPTGCDVLDSNLAQIAVYCGNAGGVTAAVGGLEVNAWGLHDLSGNVLEWCADGWLEDWGAAEQVDPYTGAANGGGDRVYRGGSLGGSARGVRAARRSYGGPGDRYGDLGLRLARTLPAAGDPDGDGVEGDTDNCSRLANPEQLDSDLDGLGDACDPRQDNLSPGFTSVPSGSFWMGSPEGCPAPAGYPGACDEEPGRVDNEALHFVSLTRPFEMKEHEVTQAEFERMTGWNPSHFGPNGDRGECGGDCPVERVSWFDALFYANRLSAASGLPPCYTLAEVACHDGSLAVDDLADTCFEEGRGGIDAALVGLNVVASPGACVGYRLPTEAEWEIAARGDWDTTFYQVGDTDGTLTHVGRTPLDPSLDPIAWYGGNTAAGYSVYDCSGWGTDASTCGPQPVGGKAPNVWGSYDLIGSVFEWVWDRHGDYPAGTPDAPDVDPSGPTTGDSWMTRGGAWFAEAIHCRAAYRSVVSPTSRYSGVGFRVVRTRFSDDDRDGDGVPDDGDGSGVDGDAPCTDGATTACDDSCPLHADATQADSDGDGLGDACDPTPSGLSDGFVFIPPGSFWMGSPEQGSACPSGYTGGACTGDGTGTMVGEPGREEHEALHRVTLTDALEIMATEVTRGDWRAVAQAQGWGEEPSWFAACAGGDACPVERVSWFEALSYANARSIAAGLTPCYVLSDCTGEIGAGCGADVSGCTAGTYRCAGVALASLHSSPAECEGYRLPTEAEWEYVYRAGSVTTFHPSPGNDGTMLEPDGCDVLDTNLDQIAVYCGNAGGVTARVGSREANGWGVYDLSGNVLEWCADGWQPDLAAGDLIDPFEAGDVGINRLYRGGSIGGPAKGVRAARRSKDTPGNRYGDLGFRLIRSLPVSGDRDGDGISGAADNCAYVGNASQTDSDGDGQGDACDPDDDGDSDPDASDCAPLDAARGHHQVEQIGDGIDNDCDGLIDEVWVDPDDPDGDGVPSDGDGSGVAGDAPCAAGGAGLRRQLPRRGEPHPARHRQRRRGRSLRGGLRLRLRPRGDGLLRRL
jgi:formylglycine-generating enzyme required for sulfatase activity